MKKIIIVTLLFFGMSMSVMAQKFMTRTGKITFFSSTPVENIEAYNNDVSSLLDGKTGDLLFIVPIKSFKFEKALMQEHFNENYMESDKFPKADFKGRIANIAEINLRKDGIYNVKAVGKLTIHGVTQNVSIPGSITIKDGKIITSSKFKVKTADYNIRIPAMVASKIAEEIEVTVNSILDQK